MPEIGKAVFVTATIASAATTDIGATDEWALSISGTTTITSFGTAANRMRFLVFAGALILTHHATTLVLPGGVSITTAAGDRCIAISDGSGNWRVWDFTRASGKPVVASTGSELGGAVPISLGGTGQTGQTAGFNALSPVTTRGDIIVRGATNNDRLAVGAANRVLRSNGTDPAWGQVALATDVSGTLPAANGGTGDTGSAWSSWTPTITSDGGTVTGATITATAAYKQIGKTTFFRINCTLTNVGSGSPTGAIRFTTPAAALIGNNAASANYINDGKVATCNVSSDGKIYVTKQDGTTLWANGNVFTVSGAYEAA